MDVEGSSREVLFRGGQFLPSFPPSGDRSARIADLAFHAAGGGLTLLGRILIIRNINTVVYFDGISGYSVRAPHLRQTWAETLKSCLDRVSWLARGRQNDPSFRRFLKRTEYVPRREVVTQRKISHAKPNLKMCKRETGAKETPRTKRRADTKIL